MNLGQESEVLEFKKSTAEKHEGLESIAAMLNKHGYGTVYFGVLDDGEVKGQPIRDSTKKEISETIYRDIEPRINPTIDTPSYGGITVLRVRFSGNQKPYSAFGKFLTRSGTQNRIMSRAELIRLVKEEDYSSPWESEFCDAKLDDIDDRALSQYYDEAVACGRLLMEAYDKEALLASLDLYHDGRLRNAALALFGKKGVAKLKLACFATEEKITFTDLKSFSGNVYDLAKEAESYILNHIDWRAEIGLKRVEIPELPPKAVREIVVNAFAHAIYDPSPEIEVDIHPDRVTIFNPGSFPSDLTPQDYVKRSIASRKRNPLMLDVLYRCKDVEKSGTGFKRMNQVCEESGVEWSSEQASYGFYFTFYRLKKGTQVKPEEEDSGSFTTLEREVLTLISNNPKISREAIAKALETSERTVTRVIGSLIKKQAIIRIGYGRFSYLEVCPKSTKES